MFVLLALISCDSSTETTYERFNADDNSVSVAVGEETQYQTDDSGEVLVDDAGDPVPVEASCTLTSTADEVELGSGSVSPSSGPIGTVHTVRVELDEDYASSVDKVEVVTSSGDRGEDVYAMDADSAGEGVWVLQLTSYGEEGETREDTITFRLYEATSTAEEDTDEGGFSLW